ncbi:MAG: hypothetical protein ACYC0X_34185 [Pirellulaceae bacterium]
MPEDDNILFVSASGGTSVSDGCAASWNLSFVATLLAMCGEVASLGFGLLWFLALGAVGGRYWWRGRGSGHVQA